MKKIFLTLTLLIQVCVESAASSSTENTHARFPTLTLSIPLSELAENNETIIILTERHRDGTQYPIFENITWFIGDSDIVEIKEMKLKAKKEGTTVIRAEVASKLSQVIEITVYKEINGYRLPPIPNKKINDSTLPGIDSNYNEVRDDVERWIYEIYGNKHPIYIDIAMQTGRAWQKLMSNPSSTKEIYDYVKAPQHCNWYYQNDLEDLGQPVLVHESINSRVSSKVINIKKRGDLFWQYDKLSSDVHYKLPSRSERKALCDFNTRKYDMIDNRIKTEQNSQSFESLPGTISSSSNNAAVKKAALLSLALSVPISEISENSVTILSLMGRYSDGTRHPVSKNVTWLIGDPDSIEISGMELTSKNEGVTVIRAQVGSILSPLISLSVYIEKNGWRLPPKPDDKLNNSTLLGIDSNDNGVRDDVERWIYKTYRNEHPMQIDIAMQTGRVWQKVLKDPSKAKEIHDYVSAPHYCNLHYQNNAIYFNESASRGASIYSQVHRRVINTKDRKDAYLQYDMLLSGDSYTLPWPSEMKALCDFNTSKY